ncbi:hypothetical protein [Arcobacter sp. LA11]|uniref:hypothetical protein n=1 Tax=Arcobacter sp. LA11 TaxID=1898176 RepID=UPI0009338FA1|nr:hypothetical protein [Arcobacter sp. LA11]
MKRNYWPLLFISIFSFTLGMIIWTIMSAIKVPVHEDEAFLKSYHDLDRDFNDVVLSNAKFLEKYDFKILINKKEFGLIISDIFLSQRAIEEKSENKNVFNNGKNNIVISVKDKNGIEQKDIEISLRVSRPTNHNNTMDFTNKEFEFIDNKFNIEVELPLKGNWNITGNFKIANDTGYLFIKSNAI